MKKEGMIDVYFRFDSTYKRFLDRLAKKIRADGVALPEDDYPKLVEYAVTVLAVRDYGLKSPPRYPAKGGARPGAGRPKKTPQDAPGEPNKPDP